MLLDKTIHATRVGFHNFAGFAIQLGRIAFRGAIKAQRAKLLIDFQRAVP